MDQVVIGKGEYMLPYLSGFQVAVLFIRNPADAAGKKRVARKYHSGQYQSQRRWCMTG